MAEKTLSGPRESVVRRLFALSMNQCAFPGCVSPIVEYETNTIVGEVCHIRARSPGGPRYDSEQVDEERHGFGNLLLLCRAHHKAIDAPENETKFSPNWLINVKAAHEERAGALPYDEPSAAILKALRLSATEYNSGAVHMDFRNASFRIGGEGGSLGGAGGYGGVLIIGGLAALPPDLSVNLDGDAGEAPGAGGGGGGTITFEARPASAQDFELGFSVSSFFAANALTSHGSLLCVLDGAWSYFPVPSVPYRALIKLAFVVECGSVEPNSYIRIDLAILCPSSAELMLASAEVAVPQTADLVKRVPRIVHAVFDVRDFGVHRILLRSGGRVLADYPIEFRSGEIVPCV